MKWIEDEYGNIESCLTERYAYEKATSYYKQRDDTRVTVYDDETRRTEYYRGGRYRGSRHNLDY